jgi:hypothetical protein
MPVYVIVDRDFRSDAEMKKLRDDAAKFGITLSIWDRKEIENYFIHAGALARLISRRGKITVVAETVEEMICLACGNLRDESVGAIADRLHQLDKSDAHSTVHKKAERIFRAMVKSRGARNVVSGKRLLAKLSEMSKKEFGVSFGAMAVCKEMRADEFDPYLVTVVKSLAQSPAPAV